MKKLTRLIVGTVLCSGTVLAQPNPSTAQVGATAGTGVAPQQQGEVDISIGQKPNLTVEEMNTQAREYQQGMTNILRRVEKLQDTARRQKDIIRLNCVADKLVQVKVNVSIADQAYASLQENIARADDGGRTHEFTRLTIINQKVLVLGAEAENCIGEDLSFVGATRVDLDVDPNIPQNDPTIPSVPEQDVSRPPAAASVYM